MIVSIFSSSLSSFTPLVLKISRISSNFPSMFSMMITCCDLDLPKASCICAIMELRPTVNGTAELNWPPAPPPPGT